MNSLSAFLFGNEALGVGIAQAVARLGDAAQAVLGRANLTTGFLLVGALLVNKTFERKVAASLRLLLFAAVFARLALPGDWTSPLGLLGGARARASTAQAGLAPGEVQVGPAEASWAVGPAFWLGLGYLLVLTVLLLRWIGARWTLARQLRAAGSSTQAAQAAALVPGLSAAAVVEHPTLGPLVAGILRPRIVLPAALVQKADPETLGFVLAHEAAHVARRDHWLVPAVQLAAIVAWPVLPVWLAARQIRGLCELACDERVLAGRPPEQRRRYGELLLRLSQGDFALAPPTMLPSFAWDLRRRLRALCRVQRWHRGGQAAFIGGCAVLLLACSGAPEAEEASKPIGSQERAESPDGDLTINPPSLTVTPTGALVLDGQEVRLEDFESRLRAALRASGSRTLRVLGANAFDRTAASPIMAAAKRAGASTISLLKESADPGMRRVCPPDALCGLRRPIPDPSEPAAPTVAPPTAAPVPPRADSSKIGSLDPEIVRKVIRAHMPEVKACHETALADRPKLAGKMAVVFTIGRTGSVTDARIENWTLGDPEVARCTAARVRGWVFPPPAGGIVMVHYPFTFSPNDDDPDSSRPSRPRP
jgi:Zn-dependent protease with chaperone function/biopolymer transport protein ExbD